MVNGFDTSALVAAEVSSHSRHIASRILSERLAAQGDRLALAPQVLSEFVHVVTDPRRFTLPLTMSDALRRANQIWNGVDTFQVFPDGKACRQFFEWMDTYRLGRKRLLDTLLAATYWSAGIRSIVTLNRADFEIFGCFTIIEA
jgi:predicted nucleic acid-binding protein